MHRPAGSLSRHNLQAETQRKETTKQGENMTIKITYEKSGLNKHGWDYVARCALTGDGARASTPQEAAHILADRILKPGQSCMIESATSYNGARITA